VSYGLWRIGLKCASNVELQFVRFMSVLVVGSVAYDTVVTSAGSREDALGGSATFFSVSCSFFTQVGLVAVVGDDFRKEDVQLLKTRGIDTSGLDQTEGKTFRWSGVYDTEDVNTRTTLDTQLNVFSGFSPKLTIKQRKTPYVFLANIDPDLQMSVLKQVEDKPKLLALDTMNYWISGKNRSLRRVVQEIDVLFIDEAEVRELANEVNLVQAARKIMDSGPSVVVVKRGDHGLLLFHNNSTFVAPAFPLERVIDPTGAGDSFAGGFLGYLASSNDLSPESFRRAAVLGSVMGSFAVESFSLDRLMSVTHSEIEGRFREFSQLSQFMPLDDDETLPWRSYT